MGTSRFSNGGSYGNKRGYEQMKHAMTLRRRLEKPEEDRLQRSLEEATIKIVELNRKLENRDKEIANLQTHLTAAESQNPEKIREDVLGALAYLEETLEKAAVTFDMIQVNRGTLGIEFMKEHNDAILRGVKILEQLLRLTPSKNEKPSEEMDDDEKDAELPL